MSRSTETNPLELIVKEARDAFIIAKADGVLEAGEVVQIAVDVARKLQRLGGLSGSEKKAIVLLTLKKGLDAAGGVASLPGLAEATPELQAKFEQQILAAAGAALDVAVAAASGQIDLRKPASWKACLPVCTSLAQASLAFVPKDQPILKEALGFAVAGVAAAPAAPAAPLAAPALALPKTPPSSPAEIAVEIPVVTAAPAAEEPLKEEASA